MKTWKWDLYTILANSYKQYEKESDKSKFYEINHAYRVDLLAGDWEWSGYVGTIPRSGREGG